MGNRRLRAWVAIAVGAIALCGSTAVAAVAATTDAGCQPGSGPQLAGHQFTSTEIAGFDPGHLRCANLAGANFAGLSLAQIDLTGAILKNADLAHADLSQATMEDTNLSGANLTDAMMIQADLKGANATGANFSGADLTQADLTNANLSKAKVSGTGFVQATLDNTSFQGATGVAPWYLFVGIAALLFFAVLALFSLRRALRNTGGTVPGLRVLLGLGGSLVAAIGFNLAVGGFLGEILSASGPPVTQTCEAGLLCTAGVSSGFIGIFGGVVVMIAGFVLRSARGSRSRRGEQAWSGQF